MRSGRTARDGKNVEEAKIKGTSAGEDLPEMWEDDQNAASTIPPAEPLTLKERAAAIFGMVSAVFLVGIIYVVIFGLVIFALTRLL